MTKKTNIRLALEIAGIAALAVLVPSCAQYGTRPDGPRLEKIMTSTMYDATRDRFRNRKVIPNNGLSEDASYTKIAKQWLFGDNVRRPPAPLPQMKPDFAAFSKDPAALSYIWFGHSTFLVHIGAKTVLLDPVFSDYAAPVNALVKRFQPPVVPLAALPKVDYIVISHDHYDHLDMKTIKSFRTKSTRFYVPLGVGAHLEGWGIPAERITELQWWESVEIENLKLTCTPAKHFSGRGLFDRNKTLWASWVVTDGKHKFYFSGDSGYDTHFKEIGVREGPFDVVFLENGQYNAMWQHVHMLPAQGQQAFADLNGKQMVPMHWGMFDLSPHNWFDPIEAAFKLAGQRGHILMTPQIGQVVRLGAEPQFTQWWRAAM